MKMRARRGAFGMVVVELAPIAQPHVLLPRPAAPKTVLEATIEHFWNEDDFVPATPLTLQGLRKWVSVGIDPRHPAAPREGMKPGELRRAKEAEAAREAQPWGWTGGGLFGPGSRIYMSVSGPRWRCCGNRFEDDHSPWCSMEGFSDPFPEST